MSPHFESLEFTSVYRGSEEAPIRTFDRNNLEIHSARQHEGPSCCLRTLMIAYHAEQSHMHVARIEERFF